MICVKDYENLALQILSPHIRDYFTCGAGEEDTLKANSESYKRYIYHICIKVVSFYIRKSIQNFNSAFIQ